MHELRAVCHPLKRGVLSYILKNHILQQKQFFLDKMRALQNKGPWHVLYI